MVRQVSEHSTRHYPYPGDRAGWARAALATGLGALTVAAVGVLGGSVLAASVSGASVLAAVAGVNLGRREARALAGFPDLADRAVRRAALVHASRAAWRSVLDVGGVAGIAVLLANLPPAGVAADWLLPVVPAAVGALAHRAGLLYERMRYVSAPLGTAVPGPVSGTVTGPVLARGARSVGRLPAAGGPVLGSLAVTGAAPVAHRAPASDRTPITHALIRRAVTELR